MRFNFPCFLIFVREVQCANTHLVEPFSGQKLTSFFKNPSLIVCVSLREVYDRCLKLSLKGAVGDSSSMETKQDVEEWKICRKNERLMLSSQPCGQDSRVVYCVMVVLYNYPGSPVLENPECVLLPASHT